jgi:hypothetical protein
VVRTEAGWIDGREVTLVIYDPGELSLSHLKEEAAKVNAFIRSDAAEAMSWLSPKQRALLSAS